MLEKKETILICDDETIIRSLLKRKLVREGYVCLEAASAEQALVTLKNNLVELVIMDIKMPGKSGTELLPEVRNLYPDTAVLMATAITDINIAIQCIKGGAFDYLAKPFNLEEVSLSVARALEKRGLELENRDYQQHLEQKVEEQSRIIRASFLNAITALANALEAKDRYTRGHSQRVAALSVAIAKNLGMSDAGLEKLKLAGLIHDIGKIGVSENILNKPGTLTDEERKLVTCHCEIGERILMPIVEDKEILDMVRHHHERYDGKGYPDGLTGEQLKQSVTILSADETSPNSGNDVGKENSLPHKASILAVADAWDAMTSDRPYRAALRPEEASKEIVREAGHQFDPEVVRAFIQIEKTEYINV